MFKGARYSENQNHSAYGFPQAARTTHGNEAALAWFAWHNATPRKRICQNRACCGRKPTRKQASVALRSGGASSGGNPHPQFPWLPQGFRDLVADPVRGTGLATEGFAAQLCLVPALCRLSHGLCSTHLPPKQTLFTSQVGFEFCSFCSCFSFRFLAGSSSTGNFDARIEGRELRL